MCLSDLHGYLQRPFQYRNCEFVNRTYYMHGNAYSRYYRSYSYRGMALEAYVPVRYYSPAFYGWAYHPWDRPVSYGWGWGGSPWYGYYSGYFAPAQFYPGPSLWLADYMLSTELAEAYQDQAAGRSQAFNDPNPGGSVTVTPEVKQVIANEVQQQLALENAEGQSMAQNILAEPESSGSRSLPRVLVLTPVHPRRFGDHLGLDFQCPQRGRRIGGEVRIRSARREDHDPTLGVAAASGR